MDGRGSFLPEMAKRLSSQLFVSSYRPFCLPLFNLVRDPETQRPKGFGFVTFEAEKDAEKALKAMNGRIVRGRLIFVEFANVRNPENDRKS
ncbi:hypothetical protein COLO4_18460 [Corchorus olitorius]|uniref:RRM domain-containing protein n=1 Tax=Corchorus olitorius TaxID=93759 RepID=A0A1R3J8Z0_9ROSI|nr:hypothetical protein COLO4_18460 [Corchorus olitorius]